MHQLYCCISEKGKLFHVLSPCVKNGTLKQKVGFMNVPGSHLYLGHDYRLDHDASPKYNPDF